MDLQIGHGRFMLGDCLERMRELPDASVDVVLTDPPYSSGTRREAGKGVRKAMTRGHRGAEWFGSDSLTATGFAFLMRECALEWNRLLKPGGHALVFIDWRMLPVLAAAIESADLRHTNVLVWDKTYFGMGSFFRNQHEMVLHFTKGIGRKAARLDVGSVLQCKPVRGGAHPTEKPVDLLLNLLSVVAYPGDTVLDPFLGSGATAVAAEKAGLGWIGIERQGEYGGLAAARVWDEVARAAKPS
jgi:site-specific DNA-methyltransferase (adenine-specific)